MSKELDAFTSEEIERLSEEGNRAAEAGQFCEAARKFEGALDLLPADIRNYKEATWLLTAIGDVWFLARDYRRALQPLLDAMKCPGAIGTPFIHLRLGQVQLELGNEVLAADELCRAYMGGGSDIFSQEESKYFDFLKCKIKRPPAGW